MLRWRHAGQKYVNRCEPWWCASWEVPSASQVRHSFTDTAVSTLELLKSLVQRAFDFWANWRKAASHAYLFSSLDVIGHGKKQIEIENEHYERNGRKIKERVSTPRPVPSRIRVATQSWSSSLNFIIDRSNVSLYTLGLMFKNKMASHALFIYTLHNKQHGSAPPLSVSFWEDRFIWIGLRADNCQR